MDSALLESLIDYLTQPFQISISSRYHAINWIAFLVAGMAVYMLARRRGEKLARTPLAFMFPKQVWLHKSTLVDIKIYVANFFVSLPRAGIRVFSTSAVSTGVYMLVHPMLGETGLTLTTGWMIALFLPVALANDLATYINHRLGHEVKLFWPFHKVHHSAEVMTPITLQRKHPVYAFIGTAIHPLTVGPVLGLIFAFFGEVGYMKIFGVNAVYAIFAATGAHLRHSHIWINYPAWLSHIFVSPAMHQIHHSIDPKHYDRNYGEVFAIWDWMFGTIYVPRGKEEITFGVLDDTLTERVQPHPTLRHAYVVPFIEFAAELKAIVDRRRKGAADAKADDNAADDTTKAVA